LKSDQWPSSKKQHEEEKKTRVEQKNEDENPSDNVSSFACYIVGRHQESDAQQYSLWNEDSLLEATAAAAWRLLMQLLHRVLWMMLLCGAVHENENDGGRWAAAVANDDCQQHLLCSNHNRLHPAPLQNIHKRLP
jgi:hypothetical protein